MKTMVEIIKVINAIIFMIKLSNDVSDLCISILQSELLKIIISSI